MAFFGSSFGVFFGEWMEERKEERKPPPLVLWRWCLTGDRAVELESELPELDVLRSDGVLP